MRNSKMLGALVALVVAVLIGCGGGGGESAKPAPNPNPTPTVAPNPPLNVQTLALSATSVRVSWGDNSSNEDGFRVKRAIGSGSFSVVGTVSSNVTTYDDTTAAASIVYTYRVEAYNSVGSTPAAVDASITTPAVPTTAPTAPSNLGAQAQSSTQINLVWIDNATNEDGFKIERKTGSSGTYAEIATVGANTVAYSATGLTASTTYYFKVRAYNTALTPNSAYSNEANATTNSATQQWVTMNTGLTNLKVRALAVDPQAHLNVYAGTDGGIFKGNAYFASWSNVSNVGANPVPQVYAIVVNQKTPSIVYMGGQIGLFKSTDSGVTWLRITTGMAAFVAVRSIAIDPVTSSTVYVGIAGGTATAAKGEAIFKSTDSGVTWFNAGGALTPLNNFVTADALAIDPVTPSTVYAGTDHGLFKSTDGGGSWTQKTSDYTYALAIDPVTPSTVYAGKYSGVSKSTDGGGSWTAINTGLVGYTTASSLAIDPVTPATVYVTLRDSAGLSYGGLYKTTNGGAQWAKVVGVTTTYVYAVVVDPKAPTTLYVGSDSGVFKSQ